MKVVKKEKIGGKFGMGEKEWSKRFKGEGGGLKDLKGNFDRLACFPYMLVGIVGVWVKFKLESFIKIELTGKVAKLYPGSFKVNLYPGSLKVNLYPGSFKVNYVIKYIKAWDTDISGWFWH